MDLKLDGRRAIVTGGSKGIGLETVRALLAEGVTVVAASRSTTPELAETDAMAVSVDLSTPEGATELVTTALERLGGIDLLVNNVGIGEPADAVRGILNDPINLPDEAWKKTFNMNFYTPLRVTRAALPSLIENDGIIVNVSTSAARQVGAGPFDYNIAKAALNGLTKVISERYGPSGVRAITVSPGPVATGVWTDPDGLQGIAAREHGMSLDERQKMIIDAASPSTGRVTTPEEVARLIVFLASPSNTTGSDYIIDGGIVKTV